MVRQSRRWWAVPTYITVEWGRRYGQLYNGRCGQREQYTDATVRVRVRVQCHAGARAMWVLGSTCRRFMNLMPDTGARAIWALRNMCSCVHADVPTLHMGSMDTEYRFTIYSVVWAMHSVQMLLV